MGPRFRAYAYAAALLFSNTQVALSRLDTHDQSTVENVQRLSGDCSAQTIQIQSIPGSSIFSLTAAAVRGYIPPPDPRFDKDGFHPIDFCNVTVVYTHTGWEDSITTTVWLPLAGWDGRFVGVGGSGFATRDYDFTLAVQVAAGHSVVATDGGHGYANLFGAKDWALDGKGQARILLLEDFASVALNDASIIGKSVTKAFYGSAPTYSYWKGCSTGGRQGFMMAQRYPTAYNGIVAEAAAINWVSMVPSDLNPILAMWQAKTIPPPCILDAIVNATIEACDGHDGLVDGIVAHPDSCNFDPHTLVGKSVNCDSFGNVTVTSTHATIVQKITQGPKSANGSSLWFGLEPGTPLTGGLELANITCVGSADNCTASLFETIEDWVKLFVLQNPNFDLSTLTNQQFDDVFATSKQRYQDIIGTDNPDLSGFKAAGGKMVSWHGLQDQLISPKGSTLYYHSVEKHDPNVREFYRHFEAPGVRHCQGGIGPNPVNPLEAVIAWVEHGTAPDTLPARSLDGKKAQALCPYPLVSVYQGGDQTKASSFACQTKFPNSIGKTTLATLQNRFTQSWLPFGRVMMQPKSLTSRFWTGLESLNFWSVAAKCEDCD